MSRQHLEDDLHMTVAAYLDLALPKDAAWTTVEHGGKRGKREAGRLKAKGVKSGWPDILIIYRGRLICIELKAGKGRLSKAQIAMQQRLTLAGALVMSECRSLDAMVAVLEQIIPLKGSVVV